MAPDVRQNLFFILFLIFVFKGSKIHYGMQRINGANVSYLRTKRIRYIIVTLRHCSLAFASDSVDPFSTP